MHPHWWQQLTLALLLGTFLIGESAAQEGVWQGQNDHPMLRATLRNKDKNAQTRVAVVEVETKNLALVDPDVHMYAGSTEGILEYQVDQGPVFATSDTRVAFRNLTPGKHTITVALVGSDYKDLGAKAGLDIDVVP